MISVGFGTAGVCDLNGGSQEFLLRRSWQLRGGELGS